MKTSPSKHPWFPLSMILLLPLPALAYNGEARDGLFSHPYKYDAAVNACLKGERRGLNANTIGECGNAQSFDLSWRNLDAWTFDGANLAAVKLAGNRTLRATSFRGTDLTQADLSDTLVSESRLERVQGDLADFRGAVLARGTIRGSRFRNARFEGTVFDQGVVEDTDFGHARFSLPPRLNRPDRASAVVARGTRFDRCDFSDADLSGADLNGAWMFQSRFAGAQLAQADLRHANLANSDFRGVRTLDAGTQLDGASLAGCQFANVVFSGTSLAGANLMKADLSGAALLDGVSLRGALLMSARLVGADLSHADLSGADLADADLTGAKVEGVRWEGATYSDATRLPFAPDVAQRLGMRPVGSQPKAPAASERMETELLLRKIEVVLHQ